MKKNDKLIVILGVAIIITVSIGIYYYDEYPPTELEIIIITTFFIYWFYTKEKPIPKSKQEKIDNEIKKMKGESIKKKLKIAMKISNTFSYYDDESFNYCYEKCWESIRESIDPDILMVDEL